MNNAVKAMAIKSIKKNDLHGREIVEGQSYWIRQSEFKDNHVDAYKQVGGNFCFVGSYSPTRFDKQA